MFSDEDVEGAYRHGMGDRETFVREETKLRERLHSAEESVRELTRRAQQAEAERDNLKRALFAKSNECRDLRDRCAALPAAGQVLSEHVDKARAVCERLFYWLAMGDEGPESELPCPEEIAELPKPIAELLEEARVAARGLGGLKDEDENHARYPCSPTCTHDDAAKPGHPERVKERSEAVKRAAQCYAPKHMNCPCGWDPPQTCHYPTPDGEPTEAAWKEAHELQKAHDRGAEAMRAACLEAVQERMRFLGITEKDAMWSLVKSAVEGAAP